MKKILVSILAVAALVGCSKADITYDDQPQEIGFTPYSKKSVKSAVTTTDYPNTLNMYVFAQAGAPDATTNAAFTEPYFRNAEFNDKSVNPSAEVDESNGIFSGTAQPYYWPNVKRLIFSGISKSGNVNATTEGAVPTYAYNTDDSEWQITLNGYAPGAGSATIGDNDLMWFPTTTSYSKDDIIGTDKAGHVDVTMKHACSWITIKIKGDAITGVNNTTWKIQNLTIESLAQSGNVILGDAADWTPSSTTSPLAFYVNNDNNIATNDGKALTTSLVDYTQLGNKCYDLVLVPQGVKYLTIKYNYISQTGLDPITEEKSILLSYGKNSDGTEKAWQPGVHYTYNITIGTSEILIEPTTTEWTTPNPAIPDVAL